MYRIQSLITSPTLLLLAGCSLVACGEDPNLDESGESGGTVQARRLSDGELQAFASTNVVPEGWIPCTDERCLIPPEVPCQNIGPTACVLQPECNLRTLACWQEGYFVDPQTGVASEGFSADDLVEMSAVAPPDADTPEVANGGFAPTPYPAGAGQRCVVACEHNSQRSCSDFDDPRSCAASPNCEWEATAICMMPCTPEGCPSCAVSHEVCREKRVEPLPCTALDQRQCLARDECEWSPIKYQVCDDDGRPCPVPDVANPPINDPGEVAGAGPVDATVSEGAAEAMIWRSHCQPRRPEPVCPVLPAMYPVCSGGLEPVAKYDDAGCLVGYRCPPVSQCEASSREACLAQGPSCKWNVTGLCQIYCDPARPDCRPCEIGECVAVQPTCEAMRDEASCKKIGGGCLWVEVEEPTYCTMICLDDGNGGCLPCDAKPVKVQRCVDASLKNL